MVCPSYKDNDTLNGSNTLMPPCFGVAPSHIQSLLMAEMLAFSKKKILLRSIQAQGS